jgi:hypothetical protein
MELPTALDQVVVHGGLIAAGRRRNLGGGRLVTFQELTAEIIASVPYNWRHTVPENFPLLRTLQFAKIVFGSEVEIPEVRLVPRPIETSIKPTMSPTQSSSGPSRVRSPGGTV